MIVCLGWGSLIWDPQNLPIKGERQIDGPVLPIEFVRQSNNGRLTLVIDPESMPVRVLWAEMTVCKLSDAIEQLKIREGTSAEKIGRWPCNMNFEFGDEIAVWAKAKEIVGVVWTALGPQFADERGRRPSQDEAVQYLSGLTGATSSLAAEYVEKAPVQIDTDYRRAITAELGWRLTRST